MSTVLERRNDRGVLLRYEIGEPQPFHDRVRARPSDRLHCAVLRSEQEIRYLRILVEVLEDAFSSLAIERFEFAFRTIEGMLNLAREELGLERRAR